MGEDKKDNRRQFLKNTSLSLLSVSVLPTLLKSHNYTVSSSKDSAISCDQSTEDAFGQGPFYTANAPTIQNNQLAAANELGTRIIISGRVYNLECSEVIPNTEIDIWHANSVGEYDNIGYNLRGKTKTNSQGFYIFESIKPGLYLNGSTFRPSHIHFKITPPGVSTLITHLYFQGDPYIPTDVAASITSGAFDASSRIIPLIANSNGDLEGYWDIVIDGNGVPVGTNNIYLDKGMIYSVSSNLFIDDLDIKYGVFTQSKVIVSVYNIRGQIVATLDERVLKPGKYSVSWRPHTNLAKGHYFVSLSINDLQFHYIKVLRQ